MRPTLGSRQRCYASWRCLSLSGRPFELPDGRVADYDVGETKIRIDGRVVTTLVTFGDPGAGPVLGAYTLEGLGLAVDPVRRRLVPARGLLLHLAPK